MKIYLATWAVFLPNAKEYMERLKSLLMSKGLIPLSPFDTESNDPQVIYKENLRMIDECDVVFANVSPFRGPHLDVGVAFEIGYATAKGKKIYTYGGSGELVDRIKNDPYVVEDFGLFDNLMIALSVEEV